MKRSPAALRSQAPSPRTASEIRNGSPDRVARAWWGGTARTRGRPAPRPRARPAPARPPSRPPDSRCAARVAPRHHSLAPHRVGRRCAVRWPWRSTSTPTQRPPSTRRSSARHVPGCWCSGCCAYRSNQRTLDLGASRIAGMQHTAATVGRLASQIVALSEIGM